MTKMTIDGNTAASHVAYAFSEVAAIYPITPSSPMAESADEWATQGRLNMWGQKLRIAEMQSEGGAAGAVHGSLTAGALTTTYTASQGLLLMIPNMYKISGELLPMVMHVSARALAAHSLNIFGDHADVMACRQTGFAMLAGNSVQEVMDLALVAHLSTLRSRVPFINFFDGFRTSHEVSKIDAIEYGEMKALFDKLGLEKDVKEFKARALNPEHPVQRGTAQNGDTYFQNRETANSYYNATPAIVQQMMDEVSALTGRKYHLFDYVGAKDAEEVIVIMGSGAETVEETINKLNAEGKKYGLIKVRLYRPFVADKFVACIPKTCKKIAVLDRTKEPGSLGEPLYLDVCTSLLEKGAEGIQVVGGRYGLGSKEFNPSMVLSVYKNLEAKKPKNHFTVGIYEDVTNTSLDFSKKYDAAPEGSTSCKFYGLGSDGTVGANKNSIKIIGDHTDMYAQAYFFYDSKKSGGITVSHLRFGKSPIQSEYLIDAADFIACHNPSYIIRYDMVSDLKKGGAFLLNAPWTSVEELEKNLPAKVKNALAKKKAKLYVIDAISIAKKLGLGGRTNTILQSAFFCINEQIMPYAEAVELMKKMAYKSFARKGDAIVQMNYNAIDSAKEHLIQIDIPASWATATEGAEMISLADNDYFRNVVAPILALEGDKLPSSAFNADGTVPTGTTKYEKRGVAVAVPKWIMENCIQCNQCAFVCPHACIRPALVAAGTEKPEGFATKPATGVPNHEFRIQVSPLDCMGCGVCVDVCPGMKGNKALTMAPFAEMEAAETKNWEYSVDLPEVDLSAVKMADVKKSQFTPSLFEFSGACAGCGETPYVKVITQLFGDRMIVANATGCSSIYGGSSPTCPYTTNKQGHGPAWANSLFEDNAEFGYGMNLAYKARRATLKDKIAKLADLWKEWAEGKAACEAWIAGMDDAEASKVAAKELIARIEECKDCGCECDALEKEIYADKDCLVKKSFWIIGGDGWAYDIGYGGLDHVLASGEDVNVLVLDTEVYSNTGGQASKSTPIGAVAKFASSGKRVKKKDLGMIAASYGYVYVAQCAMGADKAQLVKALKEAEAYHGPSLIICYAPCINHGINMSKSQSEEKAAVDCGYWHLYRYNPQAETPFSLDSKDPTGDYQSFILGETRYASLKKTQPEVAEELFRKTEESSKQRLAGYKKMAGKE
ncbi:MAG: pyruvate:ferredoxin (flavodoxin) oxidoreductase [Clostridia bacterium]|jgi:pyruvate-ferredoxin/flavodoxin oxidoreductase|nr:pyruvate:ferredoxin (flavodoxin) oxidoreductase [Clostridia bacterium]